jgi:cholesterol oxidase
VITSAVRVGGERGFYLEDAGFPEYVTWMLQMFGLPRPLWRLVKRRFVWDWVGEGPDPHLTEELSRLFSNTALRRCAPPAGDGTRRS